MHLAGHLRHLEPTLKEIKMSEFATRHKKAFCTRDDRIFGILNANKEKRV
jgi:hypothetical protein